MNTQAVAFSCSQLNQLYQICFKIKEAHIKFMSLCFQT
jgi:hypothetical protein